MKKIEKIINFTYANVLKINLNENLETENHTENVKYNDLNIAYGYYIKRIDKKLIYKGVEVYYETSDNRVTNDINYECLYYLGGGSYILEENMRTYIKYILRDNYKNKNNIEILSVEEWIIKGLVE